MLKMLLGTTNAKIYLAIGAVILTLIGSFYAYFKWSQGELATLRENNAKLETAVQIQEQTIKNLQADFRKQAEVLGEINEKFARSQEEARKLNDKLLKHDLGYLAEKKPGLVEDRINKASKDAARCFELLSGAIHTQEELAATKKSEINNECPSIANPNYAPW